MTSSGKVHLYYGDGKGKTTAAVGLAVRAFGAGFDVMFVQFLKDGNSSEISVLRDRLGIPVLAEKVTPHMSFAMTALEKTKTLACHERIWGKAMVWAGCNDSGMNNGNSPSKESSGRIIILDEILGAIEAGLFPEGKVIAFLDHRPADLEVVLTGRNPSPEIIRRADYCSQIVCSAHPYKKGTAARKGIEF